MWSDLFYPGNPERRERLISKNQELLELMKGNFRATNQLIETLKEHLGLSFSPIEVNEKASVKENCDVIIERIHEIQAEVERIDMLLKEKLEPDLYEKLKNMSLSVHEYHKVSGIIDKVFVLTGSVASIASSIVVGWLIRSGAIMSGISTVIKSIATGAAGAVTFGLCFGIDMIVGAILGSIERNQLERALGEYERALDEFRPASEKYQDSITYVRVRLEMNE